MHATATMTIANNITECEEASMALEGCVNQALSCLGLLLLLLDGAQEVVLLVWRRAGSLVGGGLFGWGRHCQLDDVRGGLLNAARSANPLE